MRNAMLTKAATAVDEDKIQQVYGPSIDGRTASEEMQRALTWHSVGQVAFVTYEEALSHLTATEKRIENNPLAADLWNVAWSRR